MSDLRPVGNGSWDPRVTYLRVFPRILPASTCEDLDSWTSLGLEIFAEQCSRMGLLYVSIFYDSASADAVDYIPQAKLSSGLLINSACTNTVHRISQVGSKSTLNEAVLWTRLALMLFVNSASASNCIPQNAPLWRQPASTLTVDSTSAGAADRTPQGSKYSLKKALLQAQLVLTLSINPASTCTADHIAQNSKYLLKNALLQTQPALTLAISPASADTADRNPQSSKLFIALLIFT
ncbi:hypothetical protein BDP27DRAFT_1440624 [Rhodocollybia butyracea]|uniref:Uncharacterized protein n=1 Tax=Rhodocollybia butyracea TaxID=206335 RepID=A0A9P5TUS1_9AGAR|nr:hypothetical protein BDP27DRAFT_1440624 [Rhodocollybia butyracea]